MGYDWCGFEEFKKRWLDNPDPSFVFKARYGMGVVRVPSLERAIANLTPQERTAFNVMLARIELEREVELMAEGK